MSLHARASREYPVQSLCMLFGVTKQAYYKRDEDALLLKVAQEEFVLQYINNIRNKDHGIGGMKLWYMYQKKFGDNKPVGRERSGRTYKQYDKERVIEGLHFQKYQRGINCARKSNILL